jgi:hypothetical protein
MKDNLCFRRRTKKAIEDYEGFNIPTEMKLPLIFLFTVKRIVVMKILHLFQ